MICKKCIAGEHDECKGCTCQHRKPRNVAVYSERVAASIKLGVPGAIVLNADMPPVDC